tara:strand:+ start:498 stop:944 length:447 start_codon:yes stop_codon:yes gene_type:complete
MSKITKKKFEELSSKINELFDLNMFKNTRKLEYVLARCLLAHTIKHKYNKTTLQYIANMYEQNGKSSDHSTILHNIRTWARFIDVKTGVKIQAQRELLRGNTVDYIMNIIDPKSTIQQKKAKLKQDIDNFNKHQVAFIEPCLENAKRI